MLKYSARWLALIILVTGANAAHLPLLSKSGPHPEVVGFWHFERDVKSETHSAAVGSVKRPGSGVYFFHEDVPGPFIYDPLQKLSYPNTASLSFDSDEKHNDALEIALNTAKASLGGQSVTLEFFFKPNGEWNGPLAMKARLDENAAEWGLESRPSGEQMLLHSFFTPAGGHTEHFRGGRPGGSAQMRDGSTEWRHLAFVYDATAKTLASYVDYYQVRTVPAPGEMKWDAGSLYIGGGPRRSSFAGLIDEVRLTKGALRPGQFLHARREPIAGVSLESPETILPRDCGYVDVKECFGALGDGRTDDTPAFREAFRVLSNHADGTHYTLYLPPGTYLLSEGLQSGRSLSVQGASTDKTVLKLRDRSPGFSHAAEPHAFWQVANAATTTAASAGSSADAAGVSIYNLTIDTGKGNPGAKALEIRADFLHRLEGLNLRSGDGAGLAGLELAASINGGALVKNLHIKGFDCGVACGALDSATTFEQVTLEGQRVAGIRVNDGMLAIRHLSSANKVPAIMSVGATSMVALLDSVLKGGTKDVAAVQAEGALYVQHLETAGYQFAIRKRLPMDEKTRVWRTDTIPGPKVNEYTGEEAGSGHGTTLAKALKLPAQNAPDVAWGDIHKDWVSVEKYADRKAGDDWRPAIQAAIDSGARTVYFPPGRYEVADAVHLHGKVDRLFGLNSRIVGGSDLQTGTPTVIFDEPDAKRAVCIDRLEIESLRHKSPATLVLKNASPGHYENGAGCGKLFVDEQLYTSDVTAASSGN
jgi:hypothetical protein